MRCVLILQFSFLLTSIKDLVYYCYSHFMTVWILSRFSGARDSEQQWDQLGHMQICTSPQSDNHASTPSLSSPTNSIKALKIWCNGLLIFNHCVWIELNWIFNLKNMYIRYIVNILCENWFIHFEQIINTCLQCFDAVGWAARRASGL